MPILKHEPYNIQESLFFWNITSFLFQEGPTFCETAAAASRADRFREWRAGGEAAMAAHRDDRSQLAYGERYTGACSAKATDRASASMGTLGYVTKILQKHMQRAWHCGVGRVRVVYGCA